LPQVLLDLNVNVASLPIIVHCQRCAGLIDAIGGDTLNNLTATAVGDRDVVVA